MNREADTVVPINELLATRWSPRAFADRTVDRETLLALFEAARWAPSSYNGQPWSFVAVQREDTEDFERALSCLVEFNQQWARTAPVLAFAVARVEFEHNGKPNAHAWYDTGQAAFALTVEAATRGLCVHQMAGFDADRARGVFSIPRECQPAAAIAIGYLGEPKILPDGIAEKEHAPRARKPLQEVVFGATWGQPPTWLAE